MAVLIHNLSVRSHSFVRGKKKQIENLLMQDQHWRTSVPVEGEYAGMADYPVVRFVIMEERPFIKPGSLKSPQNGFGFPKTLF